MRRVILYIAMSLDGYIADEHGGVSWLAGQDEGAESGDSYSAFIKEVDTVLMGWNTYHQIVTELSPDMWVYAGLTSYVVTHRDLPPLDGIRFSGENPCELVNRLKREPGKNIWICGGAELVRQLLAADLIDEYDITVIPVILGSGTRLFEAFPGERKLRLVSTRADNGMVELIYRRRHTKRVRALRQSDLSTVAEIWLDGNLSAHSFIPSEYWRSQFAPVKELLSQAELYVCEEEGEIQGFIGLDGGYIAGLFVRSGARSRGIGKQLLDFAKGRRERLTLSVYQKNLRAAAFYRREGFVLQREGTDEATGEREYHMMWER